MQIFFKMHHILSDMEDSHEQKQLGPKMGISLWLLVAVFSIVILLILNNVTNVWNVFTIYSTISWSVGMPIIIISFVGAIGSRSFRISTFKGRTSKQVNFIIPTVGSYDVLPALSRVVNSILEYAPLNLDNWRIYLITEEWSEALAEIREKFHNEHIEVVVVPLGYKTRFGAMHKSRALQYCIEKLAMDGQCNTDTWSFHLDDDASVRSDTIAAIAEHIKFKGEKYILAQGVLAFPHENSHSTIAKFADSMRPTDDLTRFYFFTSLLRTPLVGLHGENLLVRSDVEADIGWDNSDKPISDDSCFGLRFSQKYRGKSSFLPAFTYGASPSNVRDMLKQRKRWLVDLTNLGLYGPLPWKYRAMLIYSVIFWSSMIGQNIFLGILILQSLHIITFELITWPVGLMWSFMFSFWIWFYWNGLHINNSFSKDKNHFIRKAIMMVPLYFFVIGPLEAIGGIMGLYAFVKKEKKFEVIRKPN
jgi:hypothetical protein